MDMYQVHSLLIVGSKAASFKARHTLIMRSRAVHH